MKNLIFVAGLLSIAIFSWAQGITYPKNLVVANGGKFGDATQNVVLQSLHLTTQNYAYADTINTSSVQDLLVDGNFAYLAAQDSIYKVDLESMEILYRANFPAPSTYKMLLNDSVLWVGNWYGSANNNLYAFNSNDLSFKFSVPEITKGVNSMLLKNDTLVLTQNLTSSTYADSAGYLALVDVSDGSFLTNVPLNNVDDAGTLVLLEGNVVTINPASDTYGYFDNGNYITNTFGSDLAGGANKIYLTDNSVLLGVFDNKLGVYNLGTGSFIIPSLIDTVTSFVFDVVERKLYVMNNDFVNPGHGAVYDTTGLKLATFEAGFSPEVMAFHYVENFAPVVLDTRDTTAESTSKIVDVQVSDLNNDPLTTSILTQPSNGTATVYAPLQVEYTPNSGFTGIDSFSYQICDTDLPTYAKLCDEAKAYVWVDDAVGIARTDLENNFSIYPNPAVNNTLVSVKEAGEYNLRIIGLDGKLYAAQSQVYISDKLELSLQNLSAGTYFVLLEKEGKAQVQKLIKQ